MFAGLRRTALAFGPTSPLARSKAKWRNGPPRLLGMKTEQETQ
jgi:hypothetical protein